MIVALLLVSTAATGWLIWEEGRLRGVAPDLGLLPRFPQITFQFPPRATPVTVERDFEEQLLLERHRLVSWLSRQGAAPKQIATVVWEVQGREGEPSETQGEAMITAAEDALGLFLPRNFERRPLGE